MGLFFNFDRPGPGVNKNSERPKGLKLFFELFFRQIGAYVALNLFYLTSLIPAIAVLWYIFMVIINDLAQLGNDMLIAASFLALILSAFVCMIFGLSPFASGFYYVLRNFSFEKHAFIFSDFIEKCRQNAKNSWIMFLVDLAAVAISILLLRIYFILSLSNPILTAPMVLLIIALVVFALMTPYKWTMLVTFDLNKKQIYKNSLFFVLGDFKTTVKHFLASALVVLISFILVYLFPAFGIIIFVLFVLSVYGLVCQLNIYNQMQDFISQSPGGHDNIK